VQKKEKNKMWKTKSRLNIMESVYDSGAIEEKFTLSRWKGKQNF
jgi:hypothetical protein